MRSLVFYYFGYLNFSYKRKIVIRIHVFFITREYFTLSREFLLPLKNASITFMFESGESGKLLKGWEAYIKVSKSLYLPPSHRWGSSVMRVVRGGEKLIDVRSDVSEYWPLRQTVRRGERIVRTLQFYSEFSFLKLQPYGNEHVELVGKTCWWMSADESLLLQKVDPKSFRKS